jgi:hypothetical protein
MIRSTYTYDVLDVSPATYDEIHGKLVAAEYHQAIHDTPSGQIIDMHRIALRKNVAEAPKTEVRHMIPQMGRDRPYDHEHKWERQPGLLEFTSDDGKRHSQVRTEVELCAHCTATRPVQEK